MISRSHLTAQDAMRIIANSIAAFIVCGGISAAPAAEAVIGGVARAQGPCAGVSEGLRESLTAGSAVRLNETVSTGAGARLELAFDDGTHLTVGEKAEVVLDEFVYDANAASRLHAAITGPFRYVSGKLAAGATRQASITTFFATIGVRGTDFWGGPIGGVNGVVVFAGVVSVTTTAGTVILTAPGQGTDVAVPGAAPGAASLWSQDKVATALASVTFH